MDKTEIIEAMTSCRSLRETARVLNTSYTNLRYWLKRHAIEWLDHLSREEKHLCPKCGETEPQNFYSPASKFRMCKRCFNRYCSTLKIKKKLRAIEYKGGACLNCGYNKHYAALDFHHREPHKKDNDWNALRKKSWPEIIIELDKCDLLCSNCHREVHAEMVSLAGF